MRLNNLKKTALTSVFGLAALLGMSEIANAQPNRRIEKQQQKVEDQRQKVYNQQQKLERERIELAQKRHQEQLRLEQQRQEQLRRQNQINQNRYRVYRNGSYYQTDNRGVELLKQAVAQGYQQGFQAGQIDRRNRRGSSYNNSMLYRNGNYGYQSYVDSRQYQYYFQQGFQKGYQDGFNSRNQFGYNQNGRVNILEKVLLGILKFQKF